MHTRTRAGPAALQGALLARGPAARGQRRGARLLQPRDALGAGSTQLAPGDPQGQGPQGRHAARRRGGRGGTAGRTGVPRPATGHARSRLDGLCGGGGGASGQRAHLAH
eukprot:scaffold93734_cov39-Phaeocystis_antarctica.AAC.1